LKRSFVFKLIMTMTNYDYKGWYVLCVKSFHERKVYDQLLESSIEAFLPLIETIKKWSDRKKVILKPLFPSYIFVNIRTSLDFYKALNLNGAYTYIRFGVNYAKVKEHEINKIKLLIGDKEITDIDIALMPLVVGETKRITFGPLCGMDCEILKVNNQNKVIVRIDSIQLNITASIPLHYLLETSKIA